MSKSSSFELAVIMANPRYWRPTFIVRDALAITPEWVREQGFEGVATDLDGVWLDHDEPTVPDVRTTPMKSMRSAGIATGILSNVKPGTREGRVDQAALDMAVDAIVKPSECDGLIKPHQLPFDELADRMEVPKPKIVYIGDQIPKDIVGANRAGYGATILVARYGENDHPSVRRYQRPAEAIIRATLPGVPVRTSDFPELITPTRR